MHGQRASWEMKRACVGFSFAAIDEPVGLSKQPQSLEAMTSWEFSSSVWFSH
jgi:hypothetical protein